MLEHMLSLYTPELDHSLTWFISITTLIQEQHLSAECDTHKMCFLLGSFYKKTQEYVCIRYICTLKGDEVYFTHSFQTFQFSLCNILIDFCSDFNNVHSIFIQSRFHLKNDFLRSFTRINLAVDVLHDSSNLITALASLSTTHLQLFHCCCVSLNFRFIGRAPK